MFYVNRRCPYMSLEKIYCIISYEIMVSQGNSSSICNICLDNLTCPVIRRKHYSNMNRPTNYLHEFNLVPNLFLLHGNLYRIAYHLRNKIVVMVNGM